MKPPPIDPDVPAAASPWVARFSPEIPPAGRVLDVACGTGRHTRLMLQLQHPVTAVDRDVSQLGALAWDPRVRVVAADLESGPWPFAGTRFAGVIVTNYLWRPLLPTIVAAVAPGGLLIYDTFAVGQDRYGRPSNPAFLLRPEELLDAVRGELVTGAYEYGLVGEPRPAMRGRICARRPPQTRADG